MAAVERALQAAGYEKWFGPATPGAEPDVLFLLPEAYPEYREALEEYARVGENPRHEPSPLAGGHQRMMTALKRILGSVDFYRGTWPRDQADAEKALDEVYDEAHAAVVTAGGRLPAFARENPTMADLMAFSQTRFERLTEDGRTWFVSSYWKDEAGTMRRETLFDDLPERQAEDLANRLNKASAMVAHVVAKYEQFIYA